MPEVGALLREAVPPDGSEPDLDEIAHRAGRRRRHRCIARVAVPLAAAAVVLAAVVMVERDHDDAADAVAADGTAATTDPTGPSKAEELAGLLSTRRLLAVSDYTVWPRTPDEFLEYAPSDQVVVGTLEAVRPGTPATAACDDDPNDGVCLNSQNLEIVVRVERWLRPRAQEAHRLTVPWLLSNHPLGADGREVEQALRLATVPYQEAAPIGARVLLFLDVGHDGSHAWAPSTLNAIVIEDGDDVVVPSPDPGDADQPVDFDEYVAEVEELLR
jgi:hypothetical protein